jgi:hypothetical protein
MRVVPPDRFNLTNKITQIISGCVVLMTAPNRRAPHNSDGNPPTDATAEDIHPNAHGQSTVYRAYSIE